MKRANHILLFLVFLLAPNLLWAETRVRSGEHENFTRLVFYLPANVKDWTGSRVRDGYVINVVPAPVALETSEVFRFIPRTRILDVGLRNGQIWIESNCNCHMSVFQARPNVIAVDLRDGPDPSENSERANAAPDRNSISSALPMLFGDKAPEIMLAPSAVPFVPPASALSKADTDELATAMARAATAGLLSQSDGDARFEGLGIETRSALDHRGSDSASFAQSALCQSVSVLDDLPTFVPSDAWKRIEASDEVEGAPLARAMAYLSLGFGAEAADAFNKSDLSAEQAMLLAQISHFVDSPMRPATRPLKAIRHCDGVPGLIGMLATPDDAGITEERSRDFVASLSRLPPPLRAHLSAYLESRLEAAGFADAARSARFTHQRTVGDPPPQAAAGSAVRLSLLDIPTMPETPFFDPRVSGSIFETIAAGRFAPEDRILIEAWIQEAPSTTEADAASRLYVSALNRAGRPLDALSHLDARIGRRGVMRPSIEAAVSEALGAASQQLDPGALILLEARLTERPWYERLPQDVRTSFASRVAAVRTEFLGPWKRDEKDRSMAVAGIAANVIGTRSDASEIGPDKDTISSRRLAAESAIVSAAETIARSARLRAEAIDHVNAGERP